MSIISKIYRRLRLPFFNRAHGVRIDSPHASLRATYGKGVSIASGTIVDDSVSIGKYTYVNRGSSLEHCTVGNYCSISSGVFICPAEHHIETPASYPGIAPQLPDARRTVHIGHDVLISLNAIILSGVTIGDGAVIGAGAVVTHDVAPYEIVGGVPARHIRWRFSPEAIDRIRKTGWWLMDPDEIKADRALAAFLASDLTKPLQG